MPKEPEDVSRDSQRSPLRSSHTDSFPSLLVRLGISLVVSTYQAGYVITLRADQDELNTHFRSFRRPMGLAADAGKIALGVSREIVTFRNMAALAHKLEPFAKHDACYLPRSVHVTGDVDIHEMAWGKDELWFVNTRFSCLCTLDSAHSFVPRWRPSFVTALSPEDRCHLNGVCLVDHRPRYVTALGATDSREGWRANKVRGGVLIDVPSGEVMVSGLSMPHSPRLYDGRLWVLESGDGSIGTVELDSGRYEPITALGGFTRGLAFIGPYAFVGLSQVRESASFSGIPLGKRLAERICGISVVHLPSCQQVAFVQFHDKVQEIFAVEILPHRFPDLLELSDVHVGNAYALPDESLSQVAR